MILILPSYIREKLVTVVRAHSRRGHIDAVCIFSLFYGLEENFPKFDKNYHDDIMRVSQLGEETADII